MQPLILDARGVTLALALGVTLAGCSSHATERGAAGTSGASGSAGAASTSTAPTGAPAGQGGSVMSPPAAAAVKPRLIADLTGPYGTRLAFDAEGKRWALADSRSVQLGRDGTLEQKLTAPDVPHDVVWSADGARLFACPMSYELGASAWQKLPGLGKAMTSGLAEPPPPEQLGVVAATCSADGKDLIIATRFAPTRELGAEDSYRGPDERVLVLDERRALRGELYAGERETRALAIGRQLLAAGGTVVQVWDRGSLRKVSELPHKLVARALAFNAAGDRLAVLTADGAVSLWDPTSGQLLKSFAAHQGDGYAIAFHPTRPLLATGGQDGQLKLWALDGTLVHEEPMGGWVQAVAFSASGTRLGAAARSSPAHVAIYELP
jgi:WD40 repeat protein